MVKTHLPDELSSNPRVNVNTRYGPIIGGRAANGSVVFLEVPYALPPGRFEDPKELPPDFRYEDKEYIHEATYAAQPTNDGQQNDTLFEDKVGFGKPSENPLFVNIVIPPKFPASKSFPVKVYIHGGFLQFGSPHSLSSQAQYIAAERSEIWINIGYRLSAFGFLACDNPRLDGNYGFKDQWLALEWVKKNIEDFGGNPNDIHITGLSAGAHSVHQLLHHVSRLPDGVMAPFQSALLQSNAIVYKPRTPAELRPQFQALCKALNLNPDDPDVLSKLQDPSLISFSRICHVIETEALGVELGTFRACTDGEWLPRDEMESQRTGALASDLKEKGVKCIVIGDLTEEWYIYSLSHSISAPGDIPVYLRRYYQADLVQKIIGLYPTLPTDATPEECTNQFGEILSDWQVHLPVRMFARDLDKAGFPVTRYEIRWAPESSRSSGYISHGSDRVIWALREPDLTSNEMAIAKQWINEIDKVMKESQHQRYTTKDILVLDSDRSIHWTRDNKWDEKMRLETILLD